MADSAVRLLIGVKYSLVESVWWIDVQPTRAKRGPKVMPLRCRRALRVNAVAKPQNDAQSSPVAGGEPCEVMPLVSYRADAEAILRWERSDQVVHGLHEIHEVAGHRASAKQLLKVIHLMRRNYLNRVLSIVRAKRTGEWEVKKGKTSECRELYIDLENCK